MRGASNRAAREGARAEIQAVAKEFAAAAPAVLEAALRRRLDALVDAQTALGALGNEDLAAFRRAAEGAIADGAAEAGRRLADVELWLAPLVAPGVRAPTEGWDGGLPDWVVGIFRRFAPRSSSGPELGPLDDPGNRIWVALLSAARALDPVLREYGAEPASAPDLGGGHFGLAPKSAAQLDPTGVLARPWKRYRLAYGRYAALSS